MAVEPIRHLTPEEYLCRERAAERKSEYHGGELVAMSGASRAHNRINTNLVRELGVQLKGRPCDVFSQDMKTRPIATRYFYPDVIVVCGEPEFLDEEEDVVTNPAVIIEILSESTEAFDRGEKFVAYQQRESLLEYVLVAQDRVSVEHYVRQAGNAWLYERLDTLDTRLCLPSIGCAVALSDIYYRVEMNQQRDGS